MTRTAAIGFVMLGLVVVPAPAQEAKVVTFTADDGVELVADFIPAQEKPAPAVIVLNTYNLHRKGWEPLMGALHSSGFNLMCLDVRGHGESVRPESMNLAQRRKDKDEELVAEMYRDLLAAHEWLSKQPGVDLSRLGLVGGRLGCSVALDYARRDRSVDAVIGLGPKVNYRGLDSRDHITEMAKQGPRRLLLIASYGDQYPAKGLADLSEAATAHIVSGGKLSGTALLDRWNMLPLVANFLSESFGGADQPLVVASIDALKFCDLGSAMDAGIPPAKRRLFSSSAEAEARGLTRGSGSDAPQD